MSRQSCTTALHSQNGRPGSALRREGESSRCSCRDRRPCKGASTRTVRRMSHRGVPLLDTLSCVTTI